MNRELIERYLQGATAPVCAYLYDLDHLRERAGRLSAMLPPGCELFYAIKANSDAPVLAALDGAVAGYEVASLGEVVRAREVGAHARIVFGGPGKTDAELQGALERGVELIHVESELQLRRLDAVACRMGRRARVLLRVNPNPLSADSAGKRPQGTLTMGGQPTQFGIEEDAVPDLIRLARGLPGVEVVGLHLHALSNNLDADSHLALMRHYLALALRLRREHGLTLDTLNVGGGIGWTMRSRPERSTGGVFAKASARCSPRPAPAAGSCSNAGASSRPTAVTTSPRWWISSAITASGSPCCVAGRTTSGCRHRGSTIIRLRSCPMRSGPIRSRGPRCRRRRSRCAASCVRRRTCWRATSWSTA